MLNIAICCLRGGQVVKTANFCVVEHSVTEEAIHSVCSADGALLGVTSLLLVT